jgi:RNA polymerase sigma factor FliA
MTTFQSSLHATNISSAALRDLVKQYVGLVKSIAYNISSRRTQSSILNDDDLFQYGIFGLIDALERFDAHKGVKFETFAFHRIRGSILDGLRTADEMPRSMRKQQREMRQRNDVEYHTMMKLKLNVSEYQTFMHESEEVLMNPVYADLDGGVMESLPDDEKNSPVEILNSQQTRELLVKALESLEDRERLIVTLYYYEGLTFKEIGKILRLSESRVFQIHSDAIVSLRSELVSEETSF